MRRLSREAPRRGGARSCSAVGGVLSGVALARSLLAPHLGRVVLGVIAAGGVAAAGAAYAALTGPLLQLLLTRDHSAPLAISSGLFSWLPGNHVPWSSLEISVGTVCAVLVALAACKGLMHVAQARLLGGASERMGHALRLRVYHHLLRLRLRDHQRYANGDLLARVLDDTVRVQAALVDVPLTLAREGLAAVALTMVALLLAPQLMLVAIAVLPVVGWLVTLVSRRVRTAARGRQAVWGTLAAQAEQGCRAIREIKSFGGESRELDRFAGHSREAASWAERAIGKRALSPLVNEVGAAIGLGAALFFVTALRPAVGEIAPERLISFVTALLMIYRPIKGISEAMHTAAAGTASVDRLLELLALPAEHPPEVAAIGAGVELSAPASGTVCYVFEELRFRHPDSGWLIDGVSLDLSLGRLVLLTGASGAGKSTLLDIVCGLVSAQEGRVRLIVDGCSAGQSGTARSVADPSVPLLLRRHVALVPQAPRVLDGTVADNLRLAVADAPDAALWDALAAAGLDQTVLQMSRRLETPIGRGGIQLSGGEVQRLALARALLRGAPLLVLDEPTAALDQVNAAHFIRTLEQLRTRHAVLVTSHAAALREVADVVVELIGGRTIRHGVPTGPVLRSAGTSQQPSVMYQASLGDVAAVASSRG